jgi:cell division protein FtsZ
MKSPIKIKVIGVGGSGGNAVLRMRKSGIEDIELIAINTDYNDLRKSKADIQIKIDNGASHGVGTGMRPKIAQEAAEKSREEIKKAIIGADLVFIAGGLGGGTGSGASPVVANISKSLGILTIAIITLPFSFEGKRRMKIAKDSQIILKKEVDALVTIRNNKLMEALAPKTSIRDAFWACDNILREAVNSISSLILSSGVVNIDFADVKSILSDSGTALFGTGEAQGEERAKLAIEAAVDSPFINYNIQGAKGILFNVSGEDVTLSEVEKIGKMISKKVDPAAKIIFGVAQNKKIKKGFIEIAVIITGF